jgi:hypothetical protein
LSKISFNAANELLNTVFAKALIGFPESILDYLFDLLSNFCKYEEEEIKIKPSLLIGININKHIVSIPNKKSITLLTNEANKERTRSNLKSLIPLCNNGWIIYINYRPDDNEIDYGVLRHFGGIKSEPFTNMLFAEEQYSKPPPIVLFTVLSNYEVLIKNYIEPELIIDFRLKTLESDKDLNVILDNFAEDCIRWYGENTNYLQCCKNVLRLAQERNHGTICVIIEKECQVSEIELFRSDSKIILEPIDIMEFAEPLIYDAVVYPSLVKEYYAITGLLISLMDIDGICIIDTAFRIRAFNVFVKSDSDETVGGARTRAFNTIKSIKDANIVGCYFQSQDGKHEYWRNK